MNPIQPGSLGRIVLLVRDVARSLEFYRATLGLRVRGQPSEHWAALEAGDGVLLCLRGPWPEMPFNVTDFGRSPDELLFVVDDIEQAISSLRAAGISVQPIHQPAPGLKVAEFADPDGRRVALEQRG